MIGNQNQPHAGNAGDAVGNAGDALQIAQDDQNPFNAGDVVQIAQNNQNPFNAGDVVQIAQNNQNPFNVGDTIQIGLNDNTITDKDVLPINPIVEQGEVQIGNINLAPGGVVRITDPIRGNITITGGTKDNIPNTVKLEGDIQPQSISHNTDTGELEVTMMGDNNGGDVAGMENA